MNDFLQMWSLVDDKENEWFLLWSSYIEDTLIIDGKQVGSPMGITQVLSNYK